MNQYDVRSLDSLLNACLSFRQENPDEMYFMVGNIAGRDGVDANTTPVKEMLDAVAEADRSIVRYNGVGIDGVPYYSLGPNAKAVMSEGGFAVYFQRQKWLAFVAQLQQWSPILISIGALVVSVLAWQIPKSNDEAIQDVNAKIDALRKEQTTGLNALRSDQEKAQAAVETLARSVESMKSRAATQTARTKK